MCTCRAFPAKQAKTTRRSWRSCERWRPRWGVRPRSSAWPGVRLAKQPSFVPLSGARTPSQLDVLEVVERALSAEEMAELERLIPKGAVKGSRYPEAQMAHLDSER